MRLYLAVAVCLFGAKSALACSGNPTRYYQHVADVVVAGKVAPVSNSKSYVVVPKRVLKGAKLREYRVVWPEVSLEDECAFLSPSFRERGVYFLKLREDGSYDVLQTERRWKMAR